MTIIVIALLILGVVLWHGRRQNGSAPALPNKSDKSPDAGKSICRWAKTGGSKGALTEFKCQTCSAVAYSTERTGPLYCKKEFGRGEL